jgi:hypothetical protein
MSLPNATDRDLQDLLEAVEALTSDPTVLEMFDEGTDGEHGAHGPAMARRFAYGDLCDLVKRLRDERLSDPGPNPLAEKLLALGRQVH